MPIEDGKRIRILVLLRSKMLREALIQQLSKIGMQVVYSSDLADPYVVHRRVKQHRVDVVLLNIDGDLRPAIQYLCAIIRQAHARVVVTSLPENEADILSAIEAGASGVATIQTPLEELGEHIEAVVNGLTLYPPRVASLLLSRVDARSSTSGARTSGTKSAITRREREVVALIETGLTNKAIAARLCIEVQTVKNHVHNVLRKLGLDSRAEVARYARQISSPHLSTRPGYSTRQQVVNR